MLRFDKQPFHARIVLPDGRTEKRPIEVRTHPITGRTCRITFSRSQEKEPGTDVLPDPPPFAGDRSACPFCQPQMHSKTPKLVEAICPGGRMQRGASYLFPNLFPYGTYSAVSLFDDRHFVEIGKASVESYTDSFLNCRDYLLKILTYDPAAVYMAITQNHLPSAGGSLIHPHLQVHADPIPANHQRLIKRHAAGYRKKTGRQLFSDYLRREQAAGQRMIGRTGDWHWLTAFAPEGFFEIWGILPGVTRLHQVNDTQWRALAQGVLNTQAFYRSLARNGYNFGLLLLEDGSADMELRAVLTVRANYAPWVRSDITGFEVMVGDMATFEAPERIAEKARSFWC